MTTASDGAAPRTRIECTDCDFATVVQSTDDDVPDEVAAKHRRRTGHDLRVSAVGGE